MGVKMGEVNIPREPITTSTSTSSVKSKDFIKPVVENEISNLASEVFEKKPQTPIELKNTITSLIDMAQKTSKVCVVAQKIGKFLMEYGVRLFLATGAITFGLTQFAYLNFTVGGIALALGGLELLRIFNSAWFNDTNVNKAFNQIKQDLDTIGELNTKNKTQLESMDIHLKSAEQKIEEIKRNHIDIENLVTHNNKELIGLKNEILDLYKTTEEYKSKALSFFGQCDNNLKQATLYFDKCHPNIEILTHLEAHLDDMPQKAFVLKAATAAINLQKDFNNGLEHLHTLQTNLNHGLTVFAEASTLDAVIQGKINLIESKGADIIKAIQVAKETQETLGEEIHQLRGVNTVLVANSKEMDQKLEKTYADVDYARKVTENKSSQDNAISSTAGIATYVVTKKFMNPILAASVSMAVGSVAPKIYEMFVGGEELVEQKAMEAKAIPVSRNPLFEQLAVLALRKRYNINDVQERFAFTAKKIDAEMINNSMMMHG